MKKSITQRFIASALTIAVITTSTIPAYAAAAPDGQTKAETFAAQINQMEQWKQWQTDWNTVKNDWTQISLTPGSNESELNFSWYSIAAEESFIPKLLIGEGENMENVKEYLASQCKVENECDDEGRTYLSNQVTVTGLKENTTYYYQYQLEDGTYSEKKEYTTKDAENFSFIFVGDPQIGSSNPLKGTDTQEFYDAQSESVCSDAFNWKQTLDAAMKMTNGGASFVVSAGDQIQTTKKKSPNKDASKSEIEYCGYLSPERLKSLPVATSVGNHDADNANYRYHFNTPNNSELGSNGIVGGDYWFTYGKVLFMMLNTQDTNVEEHKQFIEQAVSKNTDCTWRIVTLHQDIYGSAEHSNEPEITNLRYQLVPYFEENDVDVVLSGHDHAYSRSKMLLGGKKTIEYTDDEFDTQLEKDMDAGDNPSTLTVAPGNIGENTTDEAEKTYLTYLNHVMDVDAIEQIKEVNETVVNPKGILYLSANSSSGSKYYDLVPRKQSYIANRWQGDSPTYSVIEVENDRLTVNTYRTDNNEKIDTSFSIAKVSPAANISKASVSKVKNQIYNGKEKKPSVIVKLNGKTLQQGKDYTVRYKNNRYTGKASITIQGKGIYEGTKNMNFYIMPKRAEVKSIKSLSRKTAAVNMTKLSGQSSGYRIQYSKDKSFRQAKTIDTKKALYQVKGLQSSKVYYLRVCAYKTVSGKKLCGSYSKTYKVKVK